MIRKRKISDAVGAMILFLVVSVAFSFAWQSYQWQLDSGRISQVQLMGDYVQDRFTRIIDQNVLTHKNLVDRIQKTDGAYFDFWESDAAIILKESPSFKLIEFIDSNMNIIQVVPREGNESIIGKNLSDYDINDSIWQYIANTKKTTITPWIQLYQGGEAFIIDEPIYVKDIFWGTFTAAMDYRPQLDELFEVRTDYHLHLHDEEGYRFYCSSVEECIEIKLPPELVYRRDVYVKGIDGMQVSMVLHPTAEFFSSNSDYIYFIGYVISILLSLTLAIAFYFVLQNARSRKRIANSNSVLKELNSVLDKEKTRAQEASRSKSEFLSNMSHEIRTPINVIHGLIEILKVTELSLEQREYFEMLDSSSKDLLSLVNNILEIERIEAGKIAIVKVAFQPVIKIREIVKIFEMLFEKKGLYLKFIDFTEGEKPTTIVGDEVKFGQILNNLLRNANKFTKTGGVTLYYNERRIADDQLEVEVKIADTGIGIPDNRIGVIFERFKQVDSGYTKNFEGSGLGLSIAKNFAEIQNGEISVESTVDVGTTFTVKIPMVISKLDSSAPIELNIREEKFIGKRILIVEDNMLNVMVMEKMLSPYGLITETASNGKLALEKIRNESYDLILMDIHMPVLDGIQTTVLIREMEVETSIIGLSANVTKETMTEALDAGMDAYLTKPFSKKQMLELFWIYLH